MKSSFYEKWKTFYFIIFYKKVIWKRYRHQKDKEKQPGQIFSVLKTQLVSNTVNASMGPIWSIQFKFDLTSTKSFILEEGV